MQNMSCEVRSDFRRFLVVFAFALVLASSCGDDGGGDGDDSAGNAGSGSGESCQQAGFTATDCTCVEGGPMGSRTCMQSGSRLTWSACRCPQQQGPNSCDFEGQEVRCHRCVGETEDRIVMCREDLTFDCTCPDGGVAADASAAQDAAADADGG